MLSQLFVLNGLAKAADTTTPDGEKTSFSEDLRKFVTEGTIYPHRKRSSEARSSGESRSSRTSWGEDRSSKTKWGS